MLSFKDYVVKKEATPKIHEIAVLMANRGVEPRQYILEYLQENQPLLAEGLFQALGRAWRALWAQDESPKAKYDTAVTSLRELTNMIKKWRNTSPQLTDTVLNGLANSLGILDDMRDYVGKIDTKVRTMSGAQTHSGINAQGIKFGDDIELPPEMKVKWDRITGYIKEYQNNPDKKKALSVLHRKLDELLEDMHKKLDTMNDNDPQKRQLETFLKFLMRQRQAEDIDMVRNKAYRRSSLGTLIVRPPGADNAIQAAGQGDDQLLNWFNSLPDTDQFKQFITQDAQHPIHNGEDVLKVLKKYVNYWTNNQSPDVGATGGQRHLRQGLAAHVDGAQSAGKTLGPIQTRSR